jgi:hypothetical protein
MSESPPKESDAYGKRERKWFVGEEENHPNAPGEGEGEEEGDRLMISFRRSTIYKPGDQESRDQVDKVQGGTRHDTARCKRTRIRVQWRHGDDPRAEAWPWWLGI